MSIETVYRLTDEHWESTMGMAWAVVHRFCRGEIVPPIARIHADEPWFDAHAARVGFGTLQSARDTPGLDTDRVIMIDRARTLLSEVIRAVLDEEAIARAEAGHPPPRDNPVDNGSWRLTTEEEIDVITDAMPAVIAKLGRMNAKNDPGFRALSILAAGGLVRDPQMADAARRVEEALVYYDGRGRDLAERDWCGALSAAHGLLGRAVRNSALCPIPPPFNSARTGEADTTQCLLDPGHVDRGEPHRWGRIPEGGTAPT